MYRQTTFTCLCHILHIQRILYLQHMQHIRHIHHILHVQHIVHPILTYVFAICSSITRTGVNPAARHENTQMGLWFFAGGIQRFPETRSCFTYSVHCVYSPYLTFSHILFRTLFDCCTNWLDACQSTILYEHSESAQVLYVIPVSSILGPLHLVPVCNTGTILYEMQIESADFPGASCDKTKDCKVVVREQLGPGMGNKATMESLNLEVSVA